MINIPDRLRYFLALALLGLLLYRNHDPINPVVVDPAFPPKPIIVVITEETDVASRIKLTPGQRDVLMATDEGSVWAYGHSHGAKDDAGNVLYRKVDKDNVNLPHDHPAIQAAVKGGVPSVPYCKVSNGTQGEGFEIVDREQTLRILKKYGGP